MSSLRLKAAALFAFGLTMFAVVSIIDYSPTSDVIRAAYYWKSDATFSPYNEDTLYNDFINRHQIKKVYIKMLDVDWNEHEGVVPVSKTNLIEYESPDELFRTHPKDSDYWTYQPRIINNKPFLRQGTDKEFVPVVFITNRAAAHIDSSNQQYIAHKIVSHLLLLQRYTTYPVKEIQVDCDWSQSTRDKYFSLLKYIKQITPNYTLSTTIRLHQYKNYKTTGVPPVQRGMLMLYNINNATKPSDKNSIFNYNDAVKYLPMKHEYPLSLDIALPIFSWGLVFDNDEFINLFNDFSGKSAEHLSFLKRTKTNAYVVTQDTVYNNIYLREGYTIKTEQCHDNELGDVMRAAQRIKTKGKTTVTLFDLNLFDLKQINHQTIENLYNR